MSVQLEDKLLHDISALLGLGVKSSYTLMSSVQCVPEKRNPINRVNFSENCNDLSEKVYIVTNFSLSSFFWHQLEDVLAMHEQARTISNGDVKNDLRRMGI